MNGAAWTRGQKEEFDTWASLLDEKGSQLWGWDKLVPYMKKVITSPLPLYSPHLFFHYF